MELITKQGFAKLQDTLREYGEEANKITIRIQEARDDSPEMSENKELMDAIEDQSKLDIKISKLKEKLEKIKVIDPSEYSDELKRKVNLGATVKYVNCDTNEEKTVKIVGTDEIDLNSKDVIEISYLSPIGSALLKKEVEDEVDVIIPSGEVWLEILSIDYEY